MNLKTIKLDREKYHEYVEGKEITFPAAAIDNKDDLQEGEHVLVFRDTVAANTNVSPPKSEMQSQYIGVEGMITRANIQTSAGAQIAVRKI